MGIIFYVNATYGKWSATDGKIPLDPIIVSRPASGMVKLDLVIVLRPVLGLVVIDFVEVGHLALGLGVGTLFLAIG